MKSLFNKALLMEQLKRYWALAALSFLVYFLACLLPLWNAGSAESATMYVISILEMKNPAVILLNIFAPLFAVVSVFSYMYRLNSTTAMHSLPLAKKQIFATNFLAGYLIAVVPLLAFSVLLAIVPIRMGIVSNITTYDHLRHVSFSSADMLLKGIGYNEVINTLPAVCAFLAGTLLSFTFYYTVFVIAAMLVGSRIIYLLVSILLPFLAFIFVLAFGIVATYFVYGYYFDTDMLSKFAVFTNPLILHGIFDLDSFNGAGFAKFMYFLPYYAVYITIIVASIPASAWLYQRRRLERAGEAIVFAPIKHGLIFMLSVTGMISLGGLFLMMLDSLVAMYIGFAIGFVIAFFIAQMIMERTFNVFGKYKALLKHSCVLIVAFVAIVTISNYDLLGYVGYVPKVSEIQGVCYGSPYMFKMNSKDEAVLERIFISDSEAIEDMIDLHTKVVEDRHEQRKVFLSNLSSNYRVPSVTQYIIYRLKNGKIVYREYTVSQEFMNSIGAGNRVSSDLFMSNMVWANYPQEIESLYVTLYGEAVTDDGYLTGVQYPSLNVYNRDEIKSLIEAIKRDYNNLDIASRTSAYINYNEGISISIQVKMISDGIFSYSSFYSGFNDAKNILEWLNRNGYSYVIERVQ